MQKHKNTLLAIKLQMAAKVLNNATNHTKFTRERAFNLLFQLQLHLRLKQS